MLIVGHKGAVFELGNASKQTHCSSLEKGNECTIDAP